MAPSSTILDDSGCTNAASCVQYDDDSDGLDGEDPADHLNNDGDSAFGFFSLVDEDPVELPNVIQFLDDDD